MTSALEVGGSDDLLGDDYPKNLGVDALRGADATSDKATQMQLSIGPIDC